MSRGRKVPTVQQDSVAEFWKWFAASRHRVLPLHANFTAKDFDQYLTAFNEIHRRLARIHPDLRGIWFEEGGQSVFVLGSSQLATTPVVFRTVEASLTLPDWNICAFGPPTWRAQPVWGDEGLLPCDVWATFRQTANGPTLHVYCLTKEAKRDDLTSLLLHLLHHLYEEQWLKQTFHAIEFTQHPPKLDLNGLFPIGSLKLGLETLQPAIPNIWVKAPAYRI